MAEWKYNKSLVEKDKLEMRRPILHILFHKLENLVHCEEAQMTILFVLKCHEKVPSFMKLVL